MPPPCAAQQVTLERKSALFGSLGSYPGHPGENPGVAKLKAALQRGHRGLIHRKRRLRNDSQLTARGLPVERLDGHSLEAHPLPGQRELKFVERLLGREQERCLTALLLGRKTAEPF